MTAQKHFSVLSAVLVDGNFLELHSFSLIQEQVSRWVTGTIKKKINGCSEFFQRPNAEKLLNQLRESVEVDDIIQPIWASLYLLAEMEKVMQKHASGNLDFKNTFHKVLSSLEHFTLDMPTAEFGQKIAQALGRMLPAVCPVDKRCFQAAFKKGFADAQVMVTWKSDPKVISTN